MRLPALTDGRLLRRYKRFFADVELPDGKIVTAHCPNTGSMKSCLVAGAPVQLSYHDNPRRKLKWTLERIDMGNGWVGVNTGLVNSIIAEAIEQARIDELPAVNSIRREVKVERSGLEVSRLDFLITGESGDKVYIEVKNVTLFEDGYLQFPDAVSLRAIKHLYLLERLAREGHLAVLLLAINRPEGSCFRPALQIDPDYADALKNAVENGVQLLPIRLIHRQQEIVVGGTLDYRL
ncbi:MAG: DNA/RNA nuclease SfsA [Gammaproteobacteria bacterium]|jgi:sugar fermentation stimulation protein A